MTGTSNFRQLLALALGGLLLVGCTNRSSEQSPPSADRSSAAVIPGTLALTEQMEERAGIAVRPVVRRALQSKALFSSTIEVDTSRAGVVMTPVSGTVTRVLADVGQQVRRGQVLAYISSPQLAEVQADYLTAEARVQEARAQVQLATGRVGLARAEFEREKQLNQKGISSLRESQAAEARYSGVVSELAAARSMSAAAQAQKRAAQARLSALRIATGNQITDEFPLKSPVSGIVTTRTIQPGQSVAPLSAASNGHEHLFDIADLGQVWAMLEVPQSEVAALKLGAAVEFTSEVAPGRIFRGRVVRLGENFDPQARTVAVRATIANPNGVLKPGMLVLAKAMSGGTDQPVLTVPTAAIQQVEGKDVVFVRIQPHTYRLKPVRITGRSGELAQVASGLRAGEQVVTDGSFVLKTEALKATLGGE